MTKKNYQNLRAKNARKKEWQKRKKFIENCRRVIFDELRRTALIPVQDAQEFFVDVEEFRNRLGLTSKGFYVLSHAAILKLRKEFQLWVRSQRKGNKIVRYVYGERTKVGKLLNERELQKDIAQTIGHLVNLRIQAEAMMRRGQLPAARIKGYAKLMAVPEPILRLSDDLKADHGADYEEIYQGEAKNLIHISELKDELIKRKDEEVKRVNN